MKKWKGESERWKTLIERSALAKCWKSQ
jgi:hypothetical protein